VLFHSADNTYENITYSTGFETSSSSESVWFKSLVEHNKFKNHYGNVGGRQIKVTVQLHKMWGKSQKYFMDIYSQKINSPECAC